MNQDIAGLMKRLILFFSFLAAATTDCAAQDIPGFPREDFGKVVLSTKQWAGSELETSIGLYKNEPISNYSPRSILFRLGTPVGRLDILTDVRVFPCTGFLIAPDRLMTNYHCVPDILEVPEVRGSIYLTKQSGFRYVPECLQSYRK